MMYAYFHAVPTRSDTATTNNQYASSPDTRSCRDPAINKSRTPVSAHSPRLCQASAVMVPRPSIASGSKFNGDKVPRALHVKSSYSAACPDSPIPNLTLHVSTSSTVTQEETRTFAQKALERWMSLPGKVPRHINTFSRCAHYTATGNGNGNSPRDLNSRSPATLRCSTDPADCVATQSDHAQAHKDPMTDCSAKPSPVCDKEAPIVLSPREFHPATAQCTSSSDTRLCNNLAADKSRKSGSPIQSWQDNPRAL